MRAVLKDEQGAWFVPFIAMYASMADSGQVNFYVRPTDHVKLHEKICFNAFIIFCRDWVFVRLST